MALDLRCVGGEPFFFVSHFLFFFYSFSFVLFCFVLFFLALAMALAGAVVSFRRGHVTFLFCVLFVVFYFKKRRIPSLAATDFVFFHGTCPGFIGFS